MADRPLCCRLMEYALKVTGVASHTSGIAIIYLGRKCLYTALDTLTRPPCATVKVVRSKEVTAKTLLSLVKIKSKSLELSELSVLPPLKSVLLTTLKKKCIGVLTQVVVDEVCCERGLLVFPTSVHAGVGIRRVHGENIGADAHQLRLPHQLPDG